MTQAPSDGLKQRFQAAQHRCRQWCSGWHRQQPFWWGSLLAVGFSLGVESLGLVQPLELAVYDRMTALQDDRGPDDRLLLVEVNEADIRNYQWPLSDAVLADALATLQEHKPNSIGIDIYRDIPQPPGEGEFTQQLVQPNIFGVNFFGDLQTTFVPAAAVLTQEQVGFNDMAVDNDGVVRRQFLFVEIADEAFYSFSLRLALNYLQQQSDWPPAQTQVLEPSPEGLRLGGTLLPQLPSYAGGYQEVDTGGFQTLLRYRSQTDVARKVSLSQILEQDFDPTWVEGKIVLIGITAPSLKDMILTPYSATTANSNYEMPGVELHGQITSQVLSAVLDGEEILGFLPRPLEWGWGWGWALVGGLIGWRFKHPLSLGGAGVIGAAAIMGSGVMLLGAGTWVPVVLPAIAFSLTSGIMVAYRGFYATYHDPLTGLPNRQLFVRYINQALRRNQLQSAAQPTTSSLALLFLDLDHFQAINESFGHRQGDQVLVTTARRLRQVCRAKMARLGGDEFAILLEDIASSKEALNLVDTLQDCLSQPICLDEREVNPTASFGVALGQRGYGYEPEALLRDAHTATYRAKALGKARYEVFSNGMRSQAIHRFKTESDLHQALERKEFFLNYQPLVNLKTGEIDGFEALVRWQHPERGIVPPLEFISVAEETGLIIPMGLWILEEACRQLQIWRAQFPERKIMMSVNLSSQQFKQADLVQQIGDILERTGIPGPQLKLELTESLVMDDVESAIQILLALKALRIKIGLDDFGTGYSSLSYLHRLPLDTLKIDRSFVIQMEEASESREIIKTIVALGHNLRMDIIAEGVETLAQAQQLQQLRCEYGQGYYFAKPLASEAARQALEQPPFERLDSGA